jgi:hypothetical protein
VTESISGDIELSKSFAARTMVGRTSEVVPEPVEADPDRALTAA